MASNKKKSELASKNSVSSAKRKRDTKVHYSRNSVILILALILLGGLWARLHIMGLPSMETRAESIATQEVKENIAEEVNQEFPFLPVEQKINLIEKRFAEQSKTQYNERVQEFDKVFSAFYTTDSGVPYLMGKFAYSRDTVFEKALYSGGTFLPVILGIILIILTYLILSKISVVAGLIGAAIAGFHPSIVEITQVSFQHVSSIIMVVSALMLYMAVKFRVFVDAGKKSGRLLRWVVYAAAPILTSAMIFSQNRGMLVTQKLWPNYLASQLGVVPDTFTRFIEKIGLLVFLLAVIYVIYAAIKYFVIPRSSSNTSSVSDKKQESSVTGIKGKTLDGVTLDGFTKDILTCLVFFFVLTVWIPFFTESYIAVFSSIILASILLAVFVDAGYKHFISPVKQGVTAHLGILVVAVLVVIATMFTGYQGIFQSKPTASDDTVLFSEKVKQFTQEDAVIVAWPGMSRQVSAFSGREVMPSMSEMDGLLAFWYSKYLTETDEQKAKNILALMLCEDKESMEKAIHLRFDTDIFVENYKPTCSGKIYVMVDRALLTELNSIWVYSNWIFGAKAGTQSAETPAVRTVQCGLGECSNGITYDLDNQRARYADGNYPSSFYWFNGTTLLANDFGTEYPAFFLEGDTGFIIDKSFLGTMFFRTAWLNNVEGIDIAVLHDGISQIVLTEYTVESVN